MKTLLISITIIILSLVGLVVYNVAEFQNGNEWSGVFLGIAVMVVPVVLSVGYTVMFLFSSRRETERHDQSFSIIEYLKASDFMMRSQMKNGIELSRQNRNLITSQKSLQNGQSQITSGLEHEEYLTWDDDTIDADFTDMR